MPVIPIAMASITSDKAVPRKIHIRPLPPVKDKPRSTPTDSTTLMPTSKT